MFARQEGWMPQPHTLEQVQEFTEYLDSLISKETNSKNTYLTIKKPLTTKRQKEIYHWIENEQAMCNPPEAPIWMADYTFKPIGDIKIGDEIIGWEYRDLLNRNNKEKKEFDKIGRKMTNKREHLTKAFVLSINRRISPIVKVTMESGSVIRCTPDHLWSSAEKNRWDNPWIRVKVGKHLRKIVDIYPNNPPDLRTAAWLGGMYDGEGSYGRIAQSLEHNPDVHARLIEAMKIFEFKQKFTSGKVGVNPIGYDYMGVNINGELTGKAKFAAWCKPVRIKSLEKSILKTVKGHRDKIVDIKYDGEGEVVSMKTTTGNYVAWGYASKNCSMSSEYWESRFAFVCDEKGQIYKFSPRLSQRIYDSVISDFDEKQVSIELLILKGRQLGITTQTALKFIHRIMFVPHTQAIMASVKASASELIERILDTAYNRCPWWLVPRKLPKRAFDNGSILSIQSGMQATGLAQGWTPTSVHLSELADVPDPKRTIEEGLFRATHSSKNLFMVLEGTGGGNTGWLAETWRASKADWPRGRSRLCPVFIPWPMCPEIYPETDWIRKFPVEGGWKPAEMTRKHIMRCESYIRNTPYLAKVAGKDWSMPIEQQWFWEFNYQSACKNHTQKTWAAQMPADDFESLTGLNDAVFGIETTNMIDNDIYTVIGSNDIGEDTKVRKAPLLAYGITGHSIQEKFNPDPSTIDWDKEAIRITWVSNRGERYDWEMIPLLAVNEDVEAETMDKLLVYEEPKEGEEYSCGIDTAHGLGKEDEDRTCISLTKKGVNAGYDSQVAEYTSNKLSPAQTVPFAACIAAWYGKKNKDPRGVKFAIEQTMGPGDICQNQLKIMGFNHHIKSFRLYAKKIKDEQKNREGFYSNSVTVPILMDFYTEAVDGGWYKPKSKWHIEELKTLERHVKDGGKDRMEHRQGQHDDRVRAAAMSYVAFHTYDDLAARSQRRYDAPQGKKSLTKGICTANSVTIGEGWDE